MGVEYDYYNRPGYYYPDGSIHSVYPQQSQIQKQISFKLKKYDFFKGDYVEGSVILNNINSLILNDIHLNLYLNESWSYPDGDYPNTELNNPILISIKVGIAKILKIDSNIINLNPGTFDFPFKFKLPDYLQPSFEYPKEGKRGFLRYILEAKLISQYVQGTGKTYLFIKSRPKEINCPLSFQSATNVHKWGMIDGGSTILKVSYQKTNYQMKGQIPIIVEVNNTRGKIPVKSINVKAIRRIQFKKAQEGVIRFHLEDVMVNKVFGVNVPPNTNSQAYTYNIELKEESLSCFNYNGVANPYPKIGDICYVMPTTDGAAVKCDYFLVVTVSFTSFVTKAYVPKVIIPFALTHQLQEDYNLEQKEDEDLKKAIEASLLDMKKSNEINQININEIDSNNNDENNIKAEEKIDIENINKVDDNNHISQNNNINNNHENNNINNINEIINENNNQEVINSININYNNNNINNIENEIGDDDNFNNIKYNDNDEINPYKSSLEGNIQNNKGPNNFSINDFDDENDK